MLKSVSCRLCSVFAIFLLLSGCSKTKRPYRPTSQELRLNLHTDPPTLDPRRATDTTSATIIKMCFEGLMRMDAQGEPEFAAAEHMERSDDQKRYLFTLRETVWADGHPVTAYDFERTWKQVLDPSFPCEFALYLYLLKNGKAAKEGRCPLDAIGVRALDAKTLQIELEHPSPYFLASLTTHFFAAVPTHLAGSDSEWTQNHYIGNGPFKLVEWRPHHCLTLQPNPLYWDLAKVHLEKLQFFFIEDSATELAMYENGELDWAGHPFSALPEEAILHLEKQGSLQRFPIAGTYLYVFNTRIFPYHNAQLRKALSLAIDREAIIRNILFSDALPAMRLIPPFFFASPPSFHDHDVQEAKRLFESALKSLGITKEELPPIQLSYNTLSAHHKIAQAVQQQWEQTLGVRVQLCNKEWKVFLDELRKGQFQVARLGLVAPIQDPSIFLDHFRYLSSSYNHAQWTNPRFSELLEEGDNTTDPEKRQDLLQNAETLLLDEMPIIPLYFYQGAYLKHSYVQGVRLSPFFDIDLKYAYVDISP